MGKLSAMPNIGAALETKLTDAGIETPEMLIRLGSREAFRRIRLRDQTACLNLLCALEGAVQGVRWHHLPEEAKRELKEFCRGLS